ncbi:hypothetical protein HP572_07505 [Pectobacterium sp. PL64]|uniref:hypothetical protein n=1 Tax=Pectobacterium sp. PL64 TaxID=2738983 RepID=UPI001F0BD8E4|nr:hypothetical protein [Pectobacterium sp. PL64]UMO89359.1 hypothetical protein HP572_07505 [Pectobacterium sp. PL64]
MVATDERTELAEKREFAELLKATLAVYGKDSSKSVIRLYWNAVGSFDIGLIRQALSQWITDPELGRYAPKPADIIRNIQRLTGRPSWVSANEAWAIALPAQDEANTLIWTTEIAQAWRVAEPIFSDGDRVGARMAFIAAYDRLVATAQSSGVLPQWTVSEGWDKGAVKGAIEQAVNAGLLPAPDATRYLSPPVSLPPPKVDRGKRDGMLAKIQAFAGILLDQKEQREAQERHEREERRAQANKELDKRYQDELRRAADHSTTDENQAIRADQ